MGRGCRVYSPFMTPIETQMTLYMSQMAQASWHTSCSDMSEKECAITKGRDALLGPPCLCLGRLLILVGLSGCPAGHLTLIEFLNILCFFSLFPISSSNFPHLYACSQFQVLLFNLVSKCIFPSSSCMFNSFELKYNYTTFIFLLLVPPKSFHFPSPL